MGKGEGIHVSSGQRRRQRCRRGCMGHALACPQRVRKHCSPVAPARCLLLKPGPAEHALTVVHIVQPKIRGPHRAAHKGGHSLWGQEAPRGGSTQRARVWHPGQGCDCPMQHKRCQSAGAAGAVLRRTTTQHPRRCGSSKAGAPPGGTCGRGCGVAQNPQERCRCSPGASRR